MQKQQWLALGVFSGILSLTIGCGSATGIDSLSVSPASQSLAVGQSAQFTATSTTTHGQHPSTTQNVTDTVSWTSSSTAVASINSSGVATAVSPGTTTISASIQGFSGLVTNSATLTITGTGGGGPASEVVALSVIPGTQSVAVPTDTSQFLAIGTTSSGATENLTNSVNWTSSSPQIATVGASTGLAVAVSQGTATITAIYTNVSDGTAVTGTATFTVSGGASEQYTAISIIPGSQSLSASGQSSQLIALGTLGSSGLQTDVTKSQQITWSSSVPTVATVNSSGLVTGVSTGTSTITAELTNQDGSVVSATATVTATPAPAPEPLLSLTIIPSVITVGNLQDTGNFLAIGTFSTAPTVRDLTNSVTWISSAPDIFPVDSSNGTNTGTTGGIVTAYGNGGAVIIAEATDPTTGSIQTATAAFNCPLVLPNPPTVAGSCFPGSQAASLKATITIYNEGLNTAGWLITAPSATGTADVIHCGPGWTGTGGSVCSAPYPFGPNGAVTILLTAPAESGVNFGGWSSSCIPSDASGNPLPGPVYWTAAGPNYCTVTITNTPTVANPVVNPNVTVGAIFN